MKTGSGNTFKHRLFCMIIVLAIMANAANAQEYKVRMAMIGNSITYGANLTDRLHECYPAQLNTMLQEIYGDTCEIMNYGVSARTMMRSAETPIWIESQFTSALKYVPDLCLVLLGTNDSKPYRWDNWGDEFLDDYLAMIDTFRFRNPNTRFMVCYPPPIWEGHPYGTTFSDSHNDSIVVNCIMPLIDTVAKRTGSVLVDFHTPLEDSLHLFPDKLHPNAGGSEIMARIVFDKMTETNIIHQVEAGLAFVSSFEQSVKPVAAGSKILLRWSTLFADSVFLDGLPVASSGSIEVTAEVNQVYILTAKGDKNVSVFPLMLQTYIPEIKGLAISPLSEDFADGGPTVLHASHTDQYGRPMAEKTDSLTWTVIEGEGEFGEQTDTTIVFIPVAAGMVVVEAREGALSRQITLYVDNLSLTVRSINFPDIIVFPDPVHETLHFRPENMLQKRVVIRVFSLLGKLLTEREFTFSDEGSSTFELNVSGLNQGIYLYAITAGNLTRYGRFIKQKTR